MHNKTKITATVLATTCLTYATAHPGHTHAPLVGASFIQTLTQGIIHPFTGADHLLLALMLGVMLGRNAVPGTLITMGALLAGYLLALYVNVFALMSLSIMEAFILASAVLSAVMVFFYRPTRKNPYDRTSSIKGAGILPFVLSFFAFFHGVAHAYEMPHGGALGFGVGMICGMGAIFLGGIFIRHALDARASKHLPRALSVLGLGLLFVF